MWMRNPGKSKLLRVVATIVVMVGWAAFPALGKSKGQEIPTPPPAAVPAAEPEISFNGKVFCSLKRRVDLPFKGIITEVLVHSGEQVEAGKVLARYRLTPDAQAAILQRLAPPGIAENQVKLAETERSLVPLKTRQGELSQLTKKNLASQQSLEQVQKDINLLTDERQTLQNRLRQERQSLHQDQQVLKEQLGKSVSPGQVPQEANLTAPISGHVIWINPELQPGAELPPTAGVIQVGKMNPMVVRAQAFEIEAQQIKQGETAEVTLESLPGRTFQGKVNSISWSSLTPGLEQPAYYDVEISVPNPDLLLKDGLKAQVVFRNPK